MSKWEVSVATSCATYSLIARRRRQKGAPWLSPPRVGVATAESRTPLSSASSYSEYVAQLVATETSHLHTDTRRGVDQQLAAAGLERGWRQLLIHPASGVGVQVGGFGGDQLRHILTDSSTPTTKGCALAVATPTRGGDSQGAPFCPWRRAISEYVAQLVATYSLIARRRRQKGAPWLSPPGSGWRRPRRTLL